MVEVANLSIKVSSDVVNALDGLRDVQKQTKDMATVSEQETKKVEGFLGKWKMGWVAASAAAITSFYSMMKISPLLGSYIGEAFSAIGIFLDEIIWVLTPVIEPLLDLLWRFVDWFTNLPVEVKKTIAALTGLLMGAALLIPIFTMLGFAINGMEKVLDLLLPVIDELEIFGISIGPMLKDLIDSFVGLGLAGGVLAIIMKIVSTLFGQIKDEGGGTGGIISGIITKIKELTGIDFGKIKDKIAGLLGFDISSIGDSLSKGVSGLADKINLSGLITTLTSKLKEVDWLKVIDLSAIISGAVNVITSIDWEPIKSTIKTKADEVLGVIKGLLPEKVSDLLSTLASIITGEKSALDLIIQNAIRVIDWLAAAKLAAEMFMKQLTGATEKESNKVPWGRLIFSAIGIAILPFPKLLLIGATLVATITGGIRNAFSSMFDIGVELVNTFIRGIGDIGSKIKNHIESSLASVDLSLWRWATGELGFSPTLLEIGAQIPLTLSQGAAQVKPTTASTFAPTIASAGSTVTPANGAQSISINVSAPITATIKSELDVRELGRKITDIVKIELKRELKSYGRYTL